MVKKLLITRIFYEHDTFRDLFALTVVGCSDSGVTFTTIDS